MTDSGRWRLELLGPAAVVSLSDAAELLPGGYARRRAWLEARGLVHDLDGDPVVVWGEVVDAVRGDERHARAKPAPDPVDPWATAPRLKYGEQPT